MSDRWIHDAELPDGINGLIVTVDQRIPIAATIDNPNWKGNAHLIAATPELLDAALAAKSLLQWLHDEGKIWQRCGREGNESWDKLTKAIAKAEGKKCE